MSASNVDANWRSRVVAGSPYAIKADAEADAWVKATAEKALAANCASCHGADLHGKTGVPDLLDYEFIWGVTFEETNDVGPVAEIEQTIRYGVRNQDCPAVTSQAQYGDCPDTRYSEMPGYAALGTLKPEQIGDLTDYVLSLSKQDHDAAAAAHLPMPMASQALTLFRLLVASGKSELDAASVVTLYPAADHA